MKSAFPQRAGEPDAIVWHVPTGSVRDPLVRQRVSAMLGTVARSPSVAGVASPYTGRGAAQVSRDGRTAYATVTFTGLGRQVPAGDVKHVIGLVEGARAPGLEVELGGPAIQASEGVFTSASQFIGIAGGGGRCCSSRSGRCSRWPSLWSPRSSR